VQGVLPLDMYYVKVCQFCFCIGPCLDVYSVQQLRELAESKLKGMAAWPNLPLTYSPCRSAYQNSDIHIRFGTSLEAELEGGMELAESSEGEHGLCRTYCSAYQNSDIHIPIGMQC
jgi:hypothetical protein